MPRIQMRKQNRLGMAAVMGLEGYSRTHLPSDLYELIKLRASVLNQCHYCIAMHTKELRERGASDARLDAVTAGTFPHRAFDDRENAALVLTDHLTRINPEIGISDEVWDSCAAIFDDAELGNLILGIATINVWNRINVATRLEA